MRKLIVSLVMASLVPVSISCATAARPPTEGTEADPHQWLEEVESPKALDWAKQHNDKTESVLMKDPRYAAIHTDVRSILVAKDRIPEPALRGGWIYNFWQDSEHVKGLWRRTRPDEYAKAAPQWETLLDLDALAKQEGESWVWKYAACLPPAYERCLIALSRGGKDAVVMREFDIAAKSFVAGGFTAPEAKLHVGWMDLDTIWIGTDFGPGTVSSSGYPRIVKLWKRGTPLSEAREVFKGKETDMMATGGTELTPDAPPVHVVTRVPSFFESESYLYVAATGTLRKLPFPMDADYRGSYKGQLLALLRSDWELPQGKFAAGSLVSVPVQDVETSTYPFTVQTVHAPDARSTIEGVDRASDALYVATLKEVQGRVLRITRSESASRGKPGKWVSAPVALPSNGSVAIAAADPFAPGIYLSYESFLVPTTLYAYPGKGKPKVLKSLPARFDASGFETHQYQSVSKDGTKIPYFLVHKKGLALDRQQPTLLYGYGGFEVSLSPHYLGASGKAWLERGGVYALANIRGGGEFGPKWHQAAIEKNRQTAYDDFISVAADLIRRHVTSPERLGIMGGSNGGLLMGVMLTQRPDLFKAIVCQVPLLDMLRFHKLLAGASWIGEYGDPEDAEMRAVIAKYSPYQNLKKDIRYPLTFFGTSTKDDRVHPGHARKMVAKLEEMGHEVLYFENIEGGHSAAADLEQRARRTAMEYTYLWQRLGQPAQNQR